MCRMYSILDLIPSVSVPKISWPFNTSPLLLGPRNILLAGLEGSGKSTLQYRLKHHSSINAPATIGTQTLKVRHAGQDFQVVEFGGSGLCHRTAPQLRHYHNGNSVMVFLHDVRNRDMKASMENLKCHLRNMIDNGGRFIWVVLNMRDDAEIDSERVKAMVEEFEYELARFSEHVVWRVLDVAGFSGMTGKGTNLLMEQIVAVTGVYRNFKPSSAGLPPRRLSAGPSVRQCETAEEEHVYNGNILATHRDRMRATYLVMLRALEEDIGIIETADSLLVEEQEINDVEFRGHKTMVVFWLFQMQTAILKYKRKNPSASLSLETFDPVMACGRHLLMPDAWTRYYSPSILKQPEPAIYFGHPDLRDLSCQDTISLYPKTCLYRFADCVSTLHPERLLRYAFTVVKTYLSTSLNRNKVVELALSSLQSTTMRQRSAGIDVDMYSETQTYFWIQYLHWLIISHPAHDNLHEVEYAHFKGMVPIDADAWRDYYSKSRWESIEGRITYLTPDRKPLPGDSNMTTQRTEQLSNVNREWAWKKGFIPELPSDEVLDFMIEVTVLGINNPQKGTHSHLLFTLFNNFLERSLIQHPHELVQTALHLLDKEGVLSSTDERVQFWAQKVYEGLFTRAFELPKHLPKTQEQATEWFRCFLRCNVSLVHERLFEQSRVKAEVVNMMQKEILLEKIDEDSDIESVVSDKTALEDKKEKRDSPVSSQTDTETLAQEVEEEESSDWEVVKP